MRVDDDAFDAGWNLQAVVFDIFTRSAEDRVQQLFFGRQFALTLGRNLANQNIPWLDEGADLDDAMLQVTAWARLDDSDVPPRILICGSLYLAGKVLAENG